MDLLHKLVQRVRVLAAAVTQFASGEYDQRVPVGRLDEIGRLEKQFNDMAGQLVESIAQRQSLIAENTRIQERSRLSPSCIIQFHRISSRCAP